MPDESLADHNVHTGDRLLVASLCPITQGTPVVAQFTDGVFAGFYREAGGKVWLEAGNSEFDDVEAEDKERVIIEGIILGFIKESDKDLDDAPIFNL
jgi:SOS-response transcriptional repressor LexA